MSKNMVTFVQNIVKLNIDFNKLFGLNNCSTSKGFRLWSHKHHYLQELYSDGKRQKVRSNMRFETRFEIKENRLV